MLTLHVIFVTVVFIFAKYLSLYLHIFTCTYRDTYTKAHMYNQHTRGITTAGHRDLDERGGKKKLMTKNQFHESEQEIQVYRVSSIATKPFFTK